MPTLRITLSEELLRALHSDRPVDIVFDSATGEGGGTRGRKAVRKRGKKAGRKKVARKAGRRKAGRRAGAGAGGFRAGSLPARIVEWAGGRSQPFGPGDLMGKFGVTRPHASMLLSKLAGAGGPIKRSGRGVYELK